MSLVRFFDSVDKTFIGRLVERKAEQIRETDPDRIYVENVRSFFGMTTRLARTLCELAVKEGVFERRVAAICPNDARVITTYPSQKEIPERLKCLTCELNEAERYEFDAAELKFETYYKLVSDYARTRRADSREIQTDNTGSLTETSGDNGGNG